MVPGWGELWGHDQGQRDRGSEGLMVLSLSGLKGLVPFNQTRKSDVYAPRAAAPKLLISN